jgi:hypothetical protein
MWDRTDSAGFVWCSERASVGCVSDAVNGSSEWKTFDERTIYDNP